MTYKIISFVICSCLVSALCWADTNGLEQYILTRDGTYLEAEKATNSNEFAGCFQTTTNLICVKTKTYPNIQDNQNAKMAILRGLSISVKNMLICFVLERIRSNKYTDIDSLQQIMTNNNANSGNTIYKLKHIEFATFNNGNWCAAAASIVANSATKNIMEIYDNKETSVQYFHHALDKAKKLIRDKKYALALPLLSELQSLNNGNIEVNLLMADVLDKQGNKDDAQILAYRLWHNQKEAMNISQAEQLGDIFMGLGLENEALEIYNFAINKFSN